MPPSTKSTPPAMQSARRSKEDGLICRHISGVVSALEVCEEERRAVNEDSGAAEARLHRAQQSFGLLRTGQVGLHGDGLPGIILLVFRESPARYGFRLGDWRAGVMWTVGACAGLTVVMAVVARTPAFREYYGGAASGRLFWLTDGVELLGWEFFFRGFLLFALYRACGPLALLLQAVPFTLAHIGKPELETMSCIFGGAAFGYIAWRTRSFLYPFLIHWFLAVFTAMVARA